MKKLLLLWPPRISITLKNKDLKSTDFMGRRYGDYFWMFVKFGHVGFNIFPKHIRGVWKSFYWKNNLVEKYFHDKKRANILYKTIWKPK